MKEVSRRDLFKGLIPGKPQDQSLQNSLREQQNTRGDSYLGGSTQEAGEKCEDSERSSSITNAVKAGATVSVAPDPEGVNREKSEDFPERQGLSSHQKKEVSRRDLFKDLLPRKPQPLSFQEPKRKTEDRRGDIYLVEKTKEIGEKCEACDRGCEYIIAVREGRTVSVVPDPDGAKREDSDDISLCQDFISRMMKREWPV